MEEEIEMLNGFSKGLCSMLPTKCPSEPRKQVRRSTWGCYCWINKMPLFSLHIFLLWLLQEAVTRWDSCSLNVDVEIKRHRNRSVAVRPSGRYRTLSLISPFWYNTLLPWRRLQQLINKGGGFSHVWGNVRDVIIFFSSVGGCLLSPSTIFGSSLSFVNIPPVCSETKSRPVLIFKYQSHVILFLSLSVEQTHILPKPIVAGCFQLWEAFFPPNLSLFTYTPAPGLLGCLFCQSICFFPDSQ